MPEPRGMRAASRRKTPTPQPEKPPARASRRLRSQSREIETFPDMQKPARRNARQGSVTSVASDGEHDPVKTRKSRRKPAKEAAIDLTIVEEVDAEIAFDAAPATPQRIDLPLPLEQQAFRSPGAASEMSGTTAISSFSMIEAEFLEPKYMLKHMRKLCDAADEFLQHLTPADGHISDDHHNIQEMLKPGSDFAEEYHDFDEELKVHLKHFKGEENNYINVRAVHRALFGSYTDTGAIQSGISLVLYSANIIVLAKQMIDSSRSDKRVWDRLRQLDSLFPSQFMRSLGAKGSAAAGDSALLSETFDFALEIRTQLAILSLQRSASESDFDPEEALSGIFLNSDAAQENGGLIRGWTVAALGGEETGLSQELQQKVAERYNELRRFLPTDVQSLENGDVVDLEGLSSAFEWEAIVLQLLHWVRLRRHELSASIDALGGSAAILANVKQAIAAPQPAPEEATAPAPRDSPRKKRLSFGRNRRRSSRKFDPNAPIDMRTINALKARERDSGVHFDPKDPQPGDLFEEVAEEDVNGRVEPAPEDVEAALEDVVSAPGDAEAERALNEQIEQIEKDTWNEQPQGDATLVAGDDELVEVDASAPTGPPKSTQEHLAALKAIQPTGKENRKGTRFVDRQPNAVRVDFGEGFDNSQATPGPSSKALDKGKQRADPPPSAARKRAREETDSDDNAYESTDRGARVHARRQKAPVSKRARLELAAAPSAAQSTAPAAAPPSSAAAPPSHQPPAPSQPAETLRLPPRLRAPPAPSDEHESSEPSAPEMSEPTDPPPTAVPPRSTFTSQHALSLQTPLVPARGRQPRRTWTSAQEDALIAYAEQVGLSYARIEKLDQSEEGYGVLGEFSQVNLKDKARSMAVVMIRSGTGLLPGFENVVSAESKEGRRLLEAGFTW
ncbi:hypothetical protein C7974DRAFT_365598 [Boeremia exigua]|uniref:uncharacterized protein n=1 Tax=Boeremia exigua TaxID=749465 RepID=UPI001E8CEC74|nr:uncharacterized protein C7974DRAFT_365598 [Boeremia exigua]KAH6616334.1 hypothetical protein C7974DRAFT_365598 [Boeremia exigua]